MRARDYFLARRTPHAAEDDFLLQQAEVAIEIMSRCVVRYGAAPVSDVFRWSVNYRHSRRPLENTFWSAVARLWTRSWRAIPPTSRAAAFSEILQAPIPSDAFITDEDPGELLHDGLAGIERRDIGESTWASGVDQMSAALRGTNEARRLAFFRLKPIARKGLLTKTEKQELARSLWGAAHPETTGLPEIPRVDDWVYLVLPEPEPGIAEARFRAKWIGPDATEVVSGQREKVIRNVATSWNPDHVGERVIRLSDDEQEWFWEVAEEWLRHEAAQRVVRGTTADAALPRLVDVLAHRRAPASVLNQLRANARRVPQPRHPMAEWWASPVHEHRIVAACAALGVGDRSEAEDRLRIGARSSDGSTSLAAWDALGWWVRQASQTGTVPVRPPSLECVRDIGVAIGTTRESGLIGALRVARTVYNSGNTEFIEAIHSRVVEGLKRLRAELDYGAGRENRLMSDEVSIRRYWCVWLAWTMRGADKDDEVVSSWIEAGDSDPLCLVRFVRDWYAASKLREDAGDDP